MAIDTGRGARRFALPGGQTIGEGWVNDPRQAYGFAKVGITPQDTGEHEGMAGEGVAGSRPGLSAPMAGLRAAVSGGGGAVEGQDAPGTSLMRRLTSSPAEAVKYGLIDDPDVVAHRNLQAMTPGKTATEQELEREDLQQRSGLAMQGLREALSGRERTSADFESETAAERPNLPWAAHNRYVAEQAKLAQTGAQTEGQYVEPARIKAGADLAVEQAKGEQAAAGRTSAEKVAAMGGLARTLSAPNTFLTPQQTAAASSRFGEMTGGQVYSPEIEQAIQTAVAAGYPRESIIAALKQRGQIR